MTHYLEVRVLSQHPRRTKVIHVRVTATDHDAIVNRATRAGKSVSDFVRGAALHYAAPQTPMVTHEKINGVKLREVDEKIGRYLSSSDGKGGA